MNINNSFSKDILSAKHCYLGAAWRSSNLSLSYLLKSCYVHAMLSSGHMHGLLFD